MEDENKNLPDQQENQPAADAAEPAANEAFRDVDTQELTELFTQLKTQTSEILTELRARHAAPEGEQEPVADWEAQFETYRAPYRSRKENENG